MKKSILTLTIAASIFAACNSTVKSTADADSVSMSETDDMVMVDKPSVKSGKYINLTTGKEVYIVADPTTGIAVDSITKIPVEFYYDPVTMDTLYQNGLRVNNMLLNMGDGKYKLDDMKIKIDGDEIKIKTDSSKIKMEGDEMKVKSGDEKTKIDGNDTKMKSSEGKMKVEDGETKIKPNN